MSHSRLLVLVSALLLILFLGGADSAGKKKKVPGRKYVPRHGTLEQYLKCKGLSEDDCRKVEKRKSQVHIPEIEVAAKPPAEAAKVVQDVRKNNKKAHITPPNLGEGSCETLLTPSDIDQALNHQARRMKRKVKRFSSYEEKKWAIGSPLQYILDPDYSGNEKNVIRTAIAFWEKESCIRFKEVSITSSAAHLYISRYGGGCSSYVGKINTGGNPQPIFLTPSCLITVGTPIHEIMHTLGSFHEHQQEGRDRFVEVFPANSDLEEYTWTVNFDEVYDSASFGLPYDYNSVMHYGGTAFSVNNNDFTIWPKNSDFVYNMGQRSTATFTDIHVLNKFYCRKKCTGLPVPPCENGGYQDPNNCALCKCKNEWTGDNCTEIAESSAACAPETGEIFVDVGETKSIWLGHGTPGYSVGDMCYWHIKAPENCTLKMWFDENHPLMMLASGFTCYHWLELKYKNTHAITGQRFCTSNQGYTADNPLISEHDTVYASFEAYDLVGYVPVAGHMQGFKLHIEIGHSINVQEVAAINGLISALVAIPTGAL